MSVKKILLAEDDMDDQFFFLDFLCHRKDFILLPIVENGVELIELLHKTTIVNLPDIIILDQNMPKQNGLQTLRLLKEDKRYKKIPIVLYSTYATEYLLQQSIAYGAAMAISKPSSFDEYNNIMDEILSKLS